MRRLSSIVLGAMVCASVAVDASAQVVVSEVYQQIWLSNVFERSHVELLNAGSTAVDLTGWGLRAWTTDNPGVVVPLTGVMPPGGRYLVALGTPRTPTTFQMPAPDASSPVDVPWNSSFAVLDSTGAVRDVVGLGSPPMVETRPAWLNNAAMSAARKLNGCFDSGDGYYDFKERYGEPQNSSAPAVPCGPPPPCTFALSPTAVTLPGEFPQGQLHVITAEHCPWTVQGPDWLSFNTTEGIGDWFVNFLAPAIPTGGASRSGPVTIGTATATVTQPAIPPCMYSFNPSVPKTFQKIGGNDSVSIVTGAHCFDSIHAIPSDSWITILVSGPVVVFDVSPITAGVRRGTITVGTAVLSIIQGGPDADVDGLEDSWETSFGLDPTQASGINGPDGDPDADGLTNLQEQAAGSHPRGLFKRFFAEGVENSFFATSIALFTPQQAARVLLRYSTEGGVTSPQLIDVPAGARRTAYPRALASVQNTSFSTIIESDAPIVADRTVMWGYAGAGQGGYGSHAETSLAGPSTQWYLAEGSTTGNFSLFYLLQNPGTQATTVSIRYLLPGGRMPIEKSYVVAGLSRRTIVVADEDPALRSTDVSAVITSTSPTIVERAMYLSKDGRPFVAGHDSAGVVAAATEWYLAEGATGDYFDMFVLVANPQSSIVTLNVEFLLSDGRTLTKAYTVPANSRTTIWADGEEIPAGSGQRPLANVAVSTRVVASQPVIVERTMWWPGPAVTADFWFEAHNSPGSTVTAARWALADGAVGTNDGASTYVLIANTSTTPATVRVTMVPQTGTSAERLFTIAPKSRFTVPMGETFGLADTLFATLVESIGATPAQLVVERAMYSFANGVVWSAGTDALGTPLP